MTTTVQLLSAHPGELTEEQREDLKRCFQQLSYSQLKEYVLKRVKSLITNVQKHIKEDPVGSIDQELDFGRAFYCDTVIQAIRWNLAQFRINTRNPRKAPAARSKEAAELSYATDYSFRRIVYPIVADLAKLLYLRAMEANEKNTDASVHYVPILVMFNQRNTIGYPPRLAVLVTPAVITFLRGWKVFSDGDDAHQHYMNAVTKEAAQIHGIESAEPGQMLYCFNWDQVFAGNESDPENPRNAAFSFGAMFEPTFFFQIQIVRTKEGRRAFIHRRGGMAPFTNDSFFDLRRYQIEKTGEGFENSKDTCFLYALKQSGQLTEDEIRYVAFNINQSSVTFTMINTIGKHLFIAFHMHMPNRVIVKGCDGKRVPDGVTPRNIHLGFDFNHYYIFDEKLPFSKCFINNAAVMMQHDTFPANTNIRVVNVRTTYDPETGEPGQRVTFEYHRDNDVHTCTSRDLIQSLYKQGLLRAIRSDDALAVKESFIREEHYEEDVLEYCEDKLKEIVPKKKTDPITDVWFADFETTTDGDQHHPFLLCFHSANNRTGTYWVKDFNNVAHMVTTAFTQLVTSGKPQLVYFHNLNYDGAFVLPYFDVKKDTIITLGASKIIAFTALIRASSNVKTKPIPVHFRDSYALITAPLSKFGKMFNLNVHKEVLPYTFYTQENVQKLNEGYMPTLEEYMSYEIESRRDELNQVLQTVPGMLLDDRVNALAYAHYYCARDCAVLKEGVLRFRAQLLEVTKIDAFTVMTLPSVAYNFLINEGCFKGCFNLNTAPLLFIRQCVTGGRCMLRNNEKQYVDGTVMDFDAVSLYPSAMARLHTLKGHPKVVDPAQHSLAWLLQQDGCFLEIDISEVPKHLDFPLINRQTEHGRHFSNDPGPMFADNITIEDIIQYHHVPMSSIRVIRGYYYDEGKNTTIQTVIRKIFEARLKYKAEGNPLESIYKLIMNSCYGKSILKPVFKRMNTVDRAGLERELLDNSADVLCWEPLYDGDRYLLKQSKPLVMASSFPTFGVQVLSMSKRIMTEVMATAQDYNLPIYYTDTDSIHIDKSSIEPLSDLFRQRFHRELIGKNLGQFHSDFPESPAKEMYFSRYFIGVGKKAYLDILRDSQDNTSYHVRLKGIPEQAILNEARQRNPNNLLGGLYNLYADLYNGVPQTFNLIYEGAVRFVRDVNLAYRCRDDFKRRVFFEKEPEEKLDINKLNQ